MITLNPGWSVAVMDESNSVGLMVVKVSAVGRLSQILERATSTLLW